MFPAKLPKAKLAPQYKRKIYISKMSQPFHTYLTDVVDIITFFPDTTPVFSIKSDNTAEDGLTGIARL
jgi:hypothetical protein